MSYKYIIFFIIILLLSYSYYNNDVEYYYSENQDNDQDNDQGDKPIKFKNLLNLYADTDNTIFDSNVQYAMTMTIIKKIYLMNISDFNPPPPDFILGNNLPEDFKNKIIEIEPLFEQIIDLVGDRIVFKWVCENTNYNVNKCYSKCFPGFISQSDTKCSRICDNNNSDAGDSCRTICQKGYKEINKKCYKDCLPGQIDSGIKCTDKNKAITNKQSYDIKLNKKQVIDKKLFVIPFEFSILPLKNKKNLFEFSM